MNNFLFKVVNLKESPTVFRVTQVSGSLCYGEKFDGVSIRALPDHLQLASDEQEKEFIKNEFEHLSKPLGDIHLQNFARSSHDWIKYEDANIDNSDMVSQVYAKSDSLLADFTEGKTLSPSDLASIIMWVGALAVESKIDLAKECRILLQKCYSDQKNV